MTKKEKKALAQEFVVVMNSFTTHLEFKLLEIKETTVSFSVSMRRDSFVQEGSWVTFSKHYFVMVKKTLARIFKADPDFVDFNNTGAIFWVITV